MQSYLECVREDLKKCRKARLALNLKRTYLAMQRGVLLGYAVNEKGSSRIPKR